MSQLLKFTKDKLKSLCKDQNIDDKGTKQVLVDRLEEKNRSGNEAIVVPSVGREPKMDHIWIASFDIGKNNFAFCIEEMDPRRAQGTKIKNTKDDMYKKQLDETALLNGEMIVMENVSITKNCKTKGFDPQLFKNMNEVLEKFGSYFRHCSHIVIEEQMSFGRNINVQALKLGQHCYSWFLIRYPLTTIHSFHAYHKTQVLCSPTKLTKPERKKWSVQEAKRILELRGGSGCTSSTQFLEKIKSVTKQDDLCDTLVQLQAFKILQFYL